MLSTEMLNMLNSCCIAFNSGSELLHEAVLLLLILYLCLCAVISLASSLLSNILNQEWQNLVLEGHHEEIHLTMNNLLPLLY